MIQVWKNYSVCVKAIKTHRQMLNSRKLTLYQRSLYANSCMLSKIWYLSHVYPLTMYFAKEINKTIFPYIWNGNYEPVSRVTLFRPKSEGGLGILNCYIQSKVILFNSFIRCIIINDEYHNSLMLYYCYMRMNNILEIDYSVHHAALSTMP